MNSWYCEFKKIECQQYLMGKSNTLQETWSIAHLNIKNYHKDNFYWFIFTYLICFLGSCVPDALSLIYFTGWYFFPYGIMFSYNNLQYYSKLDFMDPFETSDTITDRFLRTAISFL